MGLPGRRYVKPVLVVAGVAAVVVLARVLPVAGWLEAFNERVVALGPAGMVLFALVYAAATVLMVPGSLLTLAAGASFGLLPGFAAVLLGATLGASGAFLVSRHLARQRVEAWIARKPSFVAVDKAVAREGWKVVFLTRLSPLFPFNVQNYAYGLTRTSFWQYALASFFGMMPGTFLYVYVGTLGRSGLEAAAGGGGAERFRLALQVLGLLATLGVTILITRTAKRALREAGI
jgi:uncharacterized membrane protein YdjX (TVP38/TMEM64 family)